MKYITKEEIYKNARVGMKIKYHDGNPEGMGLHSVYEGIITKTEKCYIFLYKRRRGYKKNPCSDCQIRIGIDGKPTRCFSYNGKTAIIEIEGNDFIEEEEMMI